MSILSNLELFLRVATHQSFTAAAREMGMTPPAISQRIGALEKSLNTRLFFRTTRQIKLTAEGEIMFAKLQEAMHVVEDAVEMLNTSVQGPAGTIRIHTIAHFGKQTLMPMFAEFLKNHPKVNIEVSFGDPSVLPAEEGYDIYIRNLATRRTRYVSKVLRRYPLLLVASMDYLHQHGHPKSLHELADHQWIRIQLPWGDEVPIELVPIAWKKDHLILNMPVKDCYSIVHYQSRLTVGKQVNGAINAMLSGIGITALPIHEIWPLVRAGMVRVLFPNYRMHNFQDIYIEYPERQFVPRKVRSLIDFLSKKFSESADLADDVRPLQKYLAASKQ